MWMEYQVFELCPKNMKTGNEQLIAGLDGYSIVFFPSESIIIEKPLQYICVLKK